MRTSAPTGGLHIVKQYDICRSKTKFSVLRLNIKAIKRKQMWTGCFLCKLLPQPILELKYSENSILENKWTIICKTQVWTSFGFFCISIVIINICEVTLAFKKKYCSSLSKQSPRKRKSISGSVVVGADAEADAFGKGMWSNWEWKSDRKKYYCFRFGSLRT